MQARNKVRMTSKMRPNYIVYFNFSELFTNHATYVGLKKTHFR